ncbi:hypothetical protein ACOME3_004285 [Neoechinorhynchus agilis]
MSWTTEQIESLSLVSTLYTVHGEEGEVSSADECDDLLVHTTEYYRSRPNCFPAVRQIDFSPCGQYFASAIANGHINVYDVEEPSRSVNNVMCLKYGVGNVRYIRAIPSNNDQVYHSSTKVNNDIRLLNIQSNKYVQYFKGHSDLVVSLNTSPTDDIFVSSSLDSSVRLWDRRSSQSTSSMMIRKAGLSSFSRYLVYDRFSICAFDGTGQTIAVASGSVSLKLFDIRYLHSSECIDQITLPNVSRELKIEPGALCFSSIE